MAGFVLPDFTVTFDDGRELVVTPKPRDLAAMERDGFDVNERLFSMVGFYTLTYTALRRLASTNGGIVGPVPDSIDALIACADVMPVTDEDAEGKDTGQGPSTGSSPPSP